MTTITDHGTTIIEYPGEDRLHLAAIARVLGGEEPEPVEGSDSLALYKFVSLTGILAFCEIVDGRDDVYATTKPHHMGALWRIYVAKVPGVPATGEPTPVQYTAETCPGRPCSVDCDHVG